MSSKWRKLRKNMIQTWSTHVWMWDNKGGVAVLVEVPKRPWKGVNDDFTHWMKGNAGDAIPESAPEDVGTKVTFNDGSTITHVTEGMWVSDLTACTTASFIAGMSEDEDEFLNPF